MLDPPNKLIKLVKQSRIHWQWLIIIPVIAAIPLSHRVLWPGGLGITADKSVTITVEKDALGKITKTVETTKPESGKTLWDWLSLLGVPITLAVLGYWLQQIQQNRSEKVANVQRERDLKIANEQRELAADETKEEVLQVYFDRLSALLVDKNLLAIAAKVNSQESDALQATPEEQELLASAVDVIRARTLSILRRFENDAERKTSVIRFLIEADFISKLKLDLSEANLSGATLGNAKLSGANLWGVNLSNANLWGAKLNGTKLIFANLDYANLTNVDLGGANLTYANLSSTNLSAANLREADLRGVKNFSNPQIQIKSSLNWQTATYDPEVRKQLGLDDVPQL